MESKTRVTLSIFAIVLAVCIIVSSSVVAVSRKNSASAQLRRQQVNFIQNRCQLAPYPQLCIQSLRPSSGEIRQSPKIMAYKAALATADQFHTLSQNLLNEAKNYEDECLYNVTSSYNEISNRFTQVKNFMWGNDYNIPANNQILINARNSLQNIDTNNNNCMKSLLKKAIEKGVKYAIRNTPKEFQDGVNTGTKIAENALKLLHSLSIP